MANITKDCPRVSLVDLPGIKGNLFNCPDGSVWDSRTVSLVHNGLDTVRQLYNGILNMDTYNKILAAYDAGFAESVKIGVFEWVVSSGGKSGYRFILKNQNVGLVVMVASSFCDETYNGAHLKIQCSPVFLLSRSIADIQADLDDIADDFIFQRLPSGVAVHICADFQGWKAPADLDYRLITKAKRVFKNSGIQTMEFDANDVSMVYGKGQSFTFGKQSSLQFAVYDKGKAVNDKGELPLWLPVWSQADSFDETKPVWRVEARFHHSVIQQFASGTGFKCSRLSDLEKHLTALWQYALNTNRLNQTSSYIDPFWQWLRDDVVFYHQKVLNLDYKRMYQSPSDEGLPSDRSVLICFGQMCAIYRKKKVSLSDAIHKLMGSGIWALVCETYAKRGLTADDVILDIEMKLNRRKQVH